MRLTIAICALSLAIAPAVAQKSRPHHRIAKAVATPLSTHDCGHNLALHLSSPDPTQGSLLLLELRSATRPVAEIKAAWDNREIPFWQEPKPNEQSPDVWRALLGVDLELKPETYPLTLTAKTESAEEIRCSAPIDVKEGKFATESLKVAPNFVEPNPEQLARSEAERQRLRAIFATITPDRPWDASLPYPLSAAPAG